MSSSRLPSFNDFSPGIFPDIRGPLKAVEAASGDRDAVIAAVSKLKNWPIKNKRAANVHITLHATGLMNRATSTLTDLGVAVANAPSSKEAVRLFCKHLLRNMNGLVLIDAVRGLNKRMVPASKKALKEELERLGITDLANATTDHLTLANWMVAAGIMRRRGNDYFVVDEALKELIGISSVEAAELDELEIPQRLFVVILRRIALTEGEGWIPAQRLNDECFRNNRRLFREDQMRRTVFDPLEQAGWIEVTGLTGGKGAKSGKVRAAPKLLSIPLEFVLPNFETAVPPDLRAKIDTPLAKIREMLDSPSKHQRGLGLELLSLRMILDLSLIPRGFRKRAKSTGFAEVDVTAEGKQLLFSRWMFQCKAVKRTSNVDIEDVAREVGIAVHAKAHVIAMVSTGGFSRRAYDFAREITQSTHLQFVFMNGEVVRAYLTNGAPKLLDHVDRNASEVMKQKEEQVLPEIIFEPPGAMNEAAEANDEVVTGAEDGGKASHGR